MRPLVDSFFSYSLPRNWANVVYHTLFTSLLLKILVFPIEYHNDGSMKIKKNLGKIKKAEIDRISSAFEH